MVRTRWGLVALAAAAVILVAAAPAQADTGGPRFIQINQVSDRAGVARLTDAELVNPWGLALGPTSPLWVANNGSGTATVYAGGAPGVPVTKAPLTVTSPGVTGQVFNGSDDFVIDTPAGPAPARFLFATESGDITAWERGVGTHTVVAASVAGAVYTGLTIWETPLGRFLLAANFATGGVDVFDRTFRRVDPAGVLFNDPTLPAGYAPFNVMADGERVIVTYAKRAPGGEDEEAGPGLGYVDAFTHFGLKVHRLVSAGPLNAPWGLAIAPAGFGQFAGALLVGNFGDGRIIAVRGHHVDGFVRHRDGHPVEIDGLWALQPGTATSGGMNTLWFSAGPDDERHGLLGQLIPA